MGSINRLGTQIRLPDGREATVVFNSLTGVGIMWGLHNPDPADFEGTDGGLFNDTRPEDFEWHPEAMLREPEMEKLLGMPCVGEDYEIIKESQ